VLASLLASLSPAPASGVGAGVTPPSGAKLKLRTTISSSCSSEGGASKHHKFIPNGNACCGMFAVVAGT
jgi:hypothetical protein